MPKTTPVSEKRAAANRANSARSTGPGATQGNAWKYFLRYHAQAERLYRRAVEELERLKAPRSELPNEPNVGCELDEIASFVHPKHALNEPTEPPPPPPSLTQPSPAPYPGAFCPDKAAAPSVRTKRLRLPSGQNARNRQSP
jgi:hypothetical protein